MLTHLTVNNFAIVRHLTLELNEGMSVITGETGAGKSIAIDALSLCLGYRSESSMIRHGADKADITATFSMQPTSPAYSWLQQHELLDEDNPQECILRRMINQEGRSKAFVNNRPLPISQLRELGQYLIHLNGQHAPQLLLKSEYQLEVLDNYAGIHNLLNEMSSQYQRWKKLHQQVKNFRQQCQENEARKQLLQYQVDELDEFAIKQGEFEEMEETHSRLSNSEALTALSQEVTDLLSESELNVDSMLYKAIRHLEDLVEVDSRYQSALNMLNESLIQVQEASSEVSDLAGKIEQDPDLLNELDIRISKTLQLARKHHVLPENLWQHHEFIQQELQKLVDFAGNEEQLIADEQAAHQQSIQLAEQIYQKRLEAGKKLAEQVTAQIKRLSMENGEFFIDVQHDAKRLSSNGADVVEFNLRSNLGQQAQPLAKIASGGELSRISLAVQVLTANELSTPTIIFDEVDVGISGLTATTVGKLLRQLGKKCQVLCVTHLPQVASYGHHHFNVQKYVENNQTETQMSLLTQAERVQALARLLGGSKITDTVLANAQEMLDLVE
ncbi:DNA repair protein RecN [Actinobacillus pleuropneumoniae]|uniref:DNA repair protein RecN n=1 Tax=Actinobacillus pleuropneumoniae serovar 6 str. Femo TaxID=754256 RepID=A0A828Q2W2_ACTPL|nr:DNA repair protein RecN [Actinobacillus pleuropneumoniae]EFL80651.1 DNA repair protein RecN [Actinobacillus pleuropneumoniae serovar 6 str. Femo]EFM93016.1 DNA repair protein recN [Actinobacillus pleuropneumoniae serovar 6 str. Femo]MBT9318887.1 DNA repair protein RecN [Actinobacillus pleuropneumoniae]MBT9343421.1 DNA repair protein RecN [Actinobacillus pleuropneumoniae]UKH12500.1 DNA repair protein RecN [Actinobacillus pleuropneumoniae serovar 6 str. Femo]